MHLVLAHGFRILLSPKGIDLPSQLAVIRIDGGHALKSEFLSHQVGTLVLLDDRRLESAAAHELSRAPEGANGLDLFHAADSCDVFGDDVVGRLGREGSRE